MLKNFLQKFNKLLAISETTSETNDEFSGEYVQDITLDWTVKNFRNLNIPTGESLKSPIFGGTWYLVLYPNGVNEANKDFVSLYLGSEATQNQIKDPSDINLDLYIMNYRENSSLSYFGFKTRAWIDTLGIENGLPNFCPRSDIFNEQKNLLCDGNLRLRVSLSRSKDNTIVSNCSNFITDYSEYFNDSSTSDIVITSEEDPGEIFHVHKIILGRNSTYFARMFACPNWKESKKGQVVLKDISLDVLRKMLKFLYFGKTEITSNIEFIHDLWQASDRFGIDSLKKQCEAMLFMDNMPKESASMLKILEVNEKTHSPEILDEMMHFLHHGKLSKEDYPYPEFVLELFKAGCDFGILALKKAVEDFCILKMSNKNVILYLEFADEHKLNRLKEASLQHFHLNKKAIMSNRDWEELMRRDTDLATEVFSEMLLRMQMAQLFDNL